MNIDRDKAVTASNVVGKKERDMSRRCEVAAETRAPGTRLAHVLEVGLQATRLTPFPKAAPVEKKKDSASLPKRDPPSTGPVRTITKVKGDRAGGGDAGDGSIPPSLTDVKKTIGDPTERIAVRLTFMEDYPNSVLIYMSTYFAVGPYDTDAWNVRRYVSKQDQFVINRIKQFLEDEKGTYPIDRGPGLEYDNFDNYYRANSTFSHKTLAAKSKPDLVEIANERGATAYLTWDLKNTHVTFLKNADHLISESAKSGKEWVDNGRNLWPNW